MSDYISASCQVLPGISDVAKVPESPYIPDQGDRHDFDCDSGCRSKNFRAYQDAAVRKPMIITKNGCPRTVLIAYEDYLRLAKRDRHVELTAALDDDELAAVEASMIEPGFEHLDSEVLKGKNAAD